MKMRTYRVRWEIDIDATSPEVAAEKAREIQQELDNIATVFSVRTLYGKKWSRVDVATELNDETNYTGVGNECST